MLSLRVGSSRLVGVAEPLRSEVDETPHMKCVRDLIFGGEDRALHELGTTLRRAALKLDNVSNTCANVTSRNLAVKVFDYGSGFLPAVSRFLLNVVVLPTTIDSEIVGIGFFVEVVNESLKLVFIVHNVVGWFG